MSDLKLRITYHFNTPIEVLSLDHTHTEIIHATVSNSKHTRQKFSLTNSDRTIKHLKMFKVLPATLTDMIRTEANNANKAYAKALTAQDIETAVTNLASDSSSLSVGDVLFDYSYSVDKLFVSVKVEVISAS